MNLAHSLGGPEVKQCPDGRKFVCPGGTMNCMNGSEMQCNQPFRWLDESEMVQGEMCIKMEQSVCTPEMQNSICKAFPDMCPTYSTACDKMTSEDIDLELEAKFCVKVQEPLCSRDVIEQICSLPQSSAACTALQTHCGGGVRDREFITQDHLI